MQLDAGGLFSWIIAGLIAGWLTGLVMRGSGYGLIGDLVVGLLGALIGGLLIGFFFQATVGFLGTIVVAFIGGCVLVFIVRSLGGRRRRTYMR